MPSLFTPLRAGKLYLPNRIIMAPLTRGRASQERIPTAMMCDYYRMRAEAGLIITEATAISPYGYGWLNAPAIYNEAQLAGWRYVTDAVHRAGGRIVLQLWHMGRVSHPDFLGGLTPVAPSAIAAQGDIHTPRGKKSYVTPRALSVQEIASTVQDYAAAARRAMRAGFDGVEVHGANGYLIDQFLRDSANKRTDGYGGTIEQRVRFLREVVTAVVDAVGAGRVGVRLSPTNPYKSMHDSNPVPLFMHAAEMLNPFNLAYLHVMEPLPGHALAGKGERVSPHMRAVYHGVFIANGGYDQKKGDAAIASGQADAIAYGTPFIANPDLVTRFKRGAALNMPDSATFYTEGERGYIDYKMLCH